MTVETRPILEEETAVRRHRFTVEEYDRMGEVGIFHEDDRIELIEGEIIEMAAKGDPHILSLGRCVRVFYPHLGDEFWIATQDPLRLGTRSKPEPDLMVVRLSDGIVAVAPNAENTLIVAEIADSSLRYDRNTKLPLYARAGIPEAWLVDLGNGRIERHTEPEPSGYQQSAVAARGESLPSTVLPALIIAADAVLA